MSTQTRFERRRLRTVRLFLLAFLLSLLALATASCLEASTRATAPAAYLLDSVGAYDSPPAALTDADADEGGVAGDPLGLEGGLFHLEQVSEDGRIIYYSTTLLQPQASISFGQAMRAKGWQLDDPTQDDPSLASYSWHGISGKGQAQASALVLSQGFNDGASIVVQLL